MPELPEVELVVRSLNKLVCGRRIRFAELLREKLAPESTNGSFAEHFRNSTISSVSRRGKHILVGLDNGKSVIVHLRMSGRFLILPVEVDNPKFSHAIFHLDNGKKIVFQDQRHFGYMRIVDTQNLADEKELKNLAPEPFSTEFSYGYLKDVLTSSKRPLKQLLLDQTKVTGLGNIYAAEALFLSRLNPEIRSNSVSGIKTKRLHRNIIEVFRESIDFSSTLNVNPEDIESSYYGGAYENQWRVYDREGKPCVKCQTKIRRIKQAGRSTYYCPRCQRK